MLGLWAQTRPSSPPVMAVMTILTRTSASETDCQEIMGMTVAVTASLNRLSEEELLVSARKEQFVLTVVGGKEGE